MRTKTKTLFSSDKIEVSMDDFNLIKMLGKGAFGTVVLV